MEFHLNIYLILSVVGFITGLSAFINSLLLEKRLVKKGEILLLKKEISDTKNLADIIHNISVIQIKIIENSRLIEELNEKYNKSMILK